MGKIIKESSDTIVLNKKKFSLSMKGEFKIDFASDSFGPYQYKFTREDCYFNDALEDRGTVIFPLKSKKFDNTEIFLETDDIVIAVGERGGLLGKGKDFIDIINIKTEKKYRLFTEEVNLIFNSTDKIIINAKDEGVFKTIILNIDTLEKTEEIVEELLSFFKCVYNKNTQEWFILDFKPLNDSEVDENIKYKNGYFILQKIKGYSEPTGFDRKKFIVEMELLKMDIWQESLI